MHCQSFFTDLAELVPGPPKYVGDRELDIDVEAIFGYGELIFKDIVLNVKIKNAYLQVIGMPGAIKSGTRYEVRLQQFNIDQSDHRTEKRSRHFEGVAEAHAGAKFEGWLPSIIGKFSVGGKAAALASASTGRESVSRPEIMLISPLPNNRWLIGNEESGDLRKPSGFLHGSYFQEARSSGINENFPLCSLALKQINQTFDIAIAIVVKCADFRFSVKDRWGRPTREGNIFEKEEFERRMKAKLAGISLQKGLRDAMDAPENPFVKSHEILICIATLNNFDTVRA